MNRSDTIEKGREAYTNKDWAKAYELLSAVYTTPEIERADLEKLATAAYLTGNDADCIEFWTLAHQEYLNQNNQKKAAFCAFWAGMILFNKGESARGNGWISRANRLLNEYKKECVEKGFVLIPQALGHLQKREAKKAFDLFKKAGEIAARFENKDLLTLSRLGRSQALIQQGNFADGRRLMDEVMVAVVSEEASPVIAGIVYCAVIDACRKTSDLNRAREWTTAFSRWCDKQTGLIPYRSQCLVRRAEIMQIHGEWPDAMAEVQKACELGPRSTPPATGEAYYCKAELFRLQGDFMKAEECYQQANQWGRKPQPGLALLRLAQGKKEAAVSSIQSLEKEKKDLVSRSGILPAYLDIMLETGDISASETAVGELQAISDSLNSPYLQAIALRAQGHLFLLKENPRQALDKLLHAWSRLKKMEAFYESARTRVLIGRAYLKLGDQYTAGMELDAACWMFQKLNATHDLTMAGKFNKKSGEQETFGLTRRETEILCCLATGKTNREIASDLFISERTVDRHVSNILAKLNLSSRAAATAFAFKNKII